MIFKNLLNKVFNKYCLSKVIIIFIVGLITRAFVAYFWDVNVFVEYDDLISCIYYFIMAIFTVLLHEFITYFEFGTVSNFSSDYITSEVIKFDDIVKPYNIKGKGDLTNITASNNTVVDIQSKIDQYYTFDESNPCQMNLSSLIDLPPSAFNSSFPPPVILTNWCF